MVPKIPNCHYMLLMQPSGLKFICTQFHILYTCKITTATGNNPIAVNNNNNNNNNNKEYVHAVRDLRHECKGHCRENVLRTKRKLCTATRKSEEHLTQTEMPSITRQRTYTHFWTTNPSRQLTRILSSFNLSNLLLTYKYFSVSNYHSSIYLPKNHSINPPINTVACQLTSFEEVSPLLLRGLPTRRT